MKKYYLIFLFLIYEKICFASGIHSIGQNIYQSVCADCHDGGFWGWLYGAPQLGVENEWAEFFNKSIPELVVTVIKGTEGGMDPKGGCDDCTNEEIKAAVEFIVSQTQKQL